MHEFVEERIIQYYRLVTKLNKERMEGKIHLHEYQKEMYMASHVLRELEAIALESKQENLEE